MDEIALVLPTPAAPPNGSYEANDRGSMGKQLIAHYPNGYGASVIQGPYSYGGDSGLYELAVLHESRRRVVEIGDDGMELCFRTPITNDVIGYLTAEEVVGHLHEIARLERNDLCTHKRNWEEDE